MVNARGIRRAASGKGQGIAQTRNVKPIGVTLVIEGNSRIGAFEATATHDSSSQRGFESRWEGSCRASNEVQMTASTTCHGRIFVTTIPQASRRPHRVTYSPTTSSHTWTKSASTRALQAGCMEQHQTGRLCYSPTTFTPLHVRSDGKAALSPGPGEALPPSRPWLWVSRGSSGRWWVGCSLW